MSERCVMLRRGGVWVMHAVMGQPVSVMSVRVRSSARSLWYGFNKQIKDML